MPGGEKGRTVIRPRWLLPLNSNWEIQGMVARKEFYLFELWSVRAVTDVISSSWAILLHTLYLKLKGKMICINGGPKHCQYMRKKVILMVILFQYIGHVKRVADSRLSKQFPSGLLKMGILTAHEQKKCFKDTVDTHSNNVENLTLIQMPCSIVQSTVSRWELSTKNREEHDTW